jgi:hypothetical protein
VLANRSNLGVRSAKRLGRDLFARNLKIAGFIKNIYNTNLDLEN